MKNECEYNLPDSSPEWEASYLGFFEEFNRGGYFRAHEVLEVLWLKVRGTPLADFYKGLIQLAGAFVHLQHERAGPAASLFRLARKNLQLYQPSCQGLEISPMIDLMEGWLVVLESPAPQAPLFTLRPLPQLPLPKSLPTRLAH